MAKKLTHEEFLFKSKLRHGSKYGYEDFLLSDGKVKARIICLAHGEFLQVPSEHIRGRGCPKCGRAKGDKSRTKTTEWFISRSVNINGDKYDYSKTNYSGSQNPITITCKIHGDFSQIPTNHLAGWGCKKCANKRLSIRNSKNTEWFKSKAKSVHGDQYDYSNVIYHNKKSLVQIICKTHGVFNQEPQVHLRGGGCSSCNNGGFDYLSDGYMYALISGCGSMIKIGISNNYKSRIKKLKRSTPFSFDLILVVNGSGFYVSSLEKLLLRNHETAGLIGFDGCTEWLKYSPELMNEIMEYAP